MIITIKESTLNENPKILEELLNAKIPFKIKETSISMIDDNISFDDLVKVRKKYYNYHLDPCKKWCSLRGRYYSVTKWKLFGSLLKA